MKEVLVMKTDSLSTIRLLFTTHYNTAALVPNGFGKTWCLFRHGNQSSLVFVVDIVHVWIQNHGQGTLGARKLQ